MILSRRGRRQEKQRSLVPTLLIVLITICCDSLLNKKIALAGNRTRAWSVAGTYLTTWLLVLWTYAKSWLFEKDITKMVSHKMKKRRSSNSACISFILFLVFATFVMYSLVVFFNCQRLLFICKKTPLPACIKSFYQLCVETEPDNYCGFKLTLWSW